LEKEETSKRSEENLVKKTCRELGITQKELAERTKISLPTIQRWSYTNKIPPQNIEFLNLIIKHQKVNSELEDIQKAFKTLNRFNF